MIHQTMNTGGITKMRTLFFTLFLLILYACDISDSQNPPIEDLKVRFIDGIASSDLMPVVEPDPIYFRIELELQNSNTENRFIDIRISSASVFLDSSNEFLGNIDLSTEWDGNLEPGETDTVTFLKSPSTNEAPFDPPCREKVYLEMNIKSDSDSKQFVTENLLYECAY